MLHEAQRSRIHGISGDGSGTDIIEDDRVVALSKPERCW